VARDLNVTDPFEDGDDVVHVCEPEFGREPVQLARPAPRARAWCEQVVVVSRGFARVLDPGEEEQLEIDGRALVLGRAERAEQAERVEAVAAQEAPARIHQNLRLAQPEHGLADARPVSREARKRLVVVVRSGRGGGGECGAWGGRGGPGRELDPVV